MNAINSYLLAYIYLAQLRKRRPWSVEAAANWASSAYVLEEIGLL